MTNSQAATYEGSMVRCSPRAPGFSRSNQHSNKNRGISKSDQTIGYLKEWMLINGKSFQYKCYEIGYAELSEKVTVFKKYLLLK